MFRDQFEGIETHIQEQLRDMLEKTVLDIYKRASVSERDTSITPLTGSVINAKIKAIFDLASRFKPPGS